MNSLRSEPSIEEIILADYIRLNKQLSSKIKARCPAEFEITRLLLWFMYQMMN